MGRCTELFRVRRLTSSFHFLRTHKGRRKHLHSVQRKCAKHCEASKFFFFNSKFQARREWVSLGCSFWGRGLVWRGRLWSRMQELHWVKIFQLKIVCVFLLEKKNPNNLERFFCSFSNGKLFRWGKRRLVPVSHSNCRKKRSENSYVSFCLA